MTSTSTHVEPARPFDPLIDPRGGPPPWQRAALLGAWLLLVAWLSSLHVVWRDEARAFAFATAGDTVADMWRTLRGEGHPALWYLILRGAHALTGSREVLGAAGLLIGFLAAALFAAKAPFRPWVIAAVLFSAWFASDYTVIARNYGLAALLMFVIAAWWGRIKDSPWFGVLLFLLCNVNVPAVIIAGALFLFRALEVVQTSPRDRPGEWRRLALNALLAAGGALVAFLTVYPPFNDAAVGLDKRPITTWNVVRGLFHTNSFVRDLGLGKALQLPLLVLLAGSLLIFARHRRALVVVLLTFVALKYFFFFIYMAYLRHIALFLVFLIALAWIVAKEGEVEGAARPWRLRAARIGKWMFVALLAIQSVTLLRKPVAAASKGVPFSRAADLASLMQQPALKGAILMADADMVGESVTYYRGGEPYWLLRQSRFGQWAFFTRHGRNRLTLDDMLADARMLHRRSGRPIVIALQTPIGENGDHQVMFQNRLIITPEGRERFLRQTRPLASLRPAQTDEEYDVFVYPGSAAVRAQR